MDPRLASPAWLKRHLCGYCDQTLYQAKQGTCGAIWHPAKRPCHWVAYLASSPDSPPDPYLPIRRSTAEPVAGQE